MDFEVLRKKVLDALNELRENDHQLLEVDVNERSISHKLAEYLQKKFELCVDCEYNKHGKKPKRMFREYGDVGYEDTTGKTVFPDIVIHKRGVDTDNLLVIEIKKSSNNIPRDFDKEKIIAYGKEIDYKFGLFLEINVDIPIDHLEWYENGKFRENETFRYPS